jgi:hypothetical protein
MQRRPDMTDLSSLAVVEVGIETAGFSVGQI